MDGPGRPGLRGPGAPRRPGPCRQAWRPASPGGGLAEGRPGHQTGAVEYAIQGDRHLERKKYVEAVEAYRASLRLDGANAAVWNYFGRALCGPGRRAAPAPAAAVLHLVVVESGPRRGSPDRRGGAPMDRNANSFTLTSSKCRIVLASSNRLASWSSRTRPNPMPVAFRRLRIRWVKWS